jgi:hypothetical protein
MAKKLFTLLDLCVSSLRRGHANLLCIVPILTDDPRRESEDSLATYLPPTSAATAYSTMDVAVFTVLCRAKGMPSRLAGRDEPRRTHTKGPTSRRFHILVLMHTAAQHITASRFNRTDAR